MSIFSAGGGGSSFNFVEDNVTFSNNISTAPVNAEDNDTHIVTDDGQASGEVLEVYKFDAETAAWVQIFAVRDEFILLANDNARLALAAPEENVTYIVQDRYNDGSGYNESWTFEGGVWVPLDDQEPRAEGSYTDNVGPTGHTIGVYSDGAPFGAANSFTVRETVTVMTQDPNTGQITFTNEQGTDQIATIDENELTVHAVDPTSADVRDDAHTWVVTSNGLPTGTVVSVWEYDLQSGTWFEMGGGTTCPGPMTRSSLIALRNSGSLSKDCHYVITDYNRGTVGAAEVILHAVDDNTLSMDVSVATGFDNLAWSGRYDIDTNRMTALHDNIGNSVHGQEIVDTFPWGNATVYDNTVEEGGSLNFVQGNFFDNVIRSGADVRVDSTGGNVAGNVFGERSGTTKTGSGDFRENIIHSDATVTSSTTGNVDNNTFGHLSIINVSAGNADTNTVGNNSNLTVSGGNVQDNVIDSDSSLTVLGGSVYENVIQASSDVRQTVNNRNFYQNQVARNSTVVQGNCNFHGNEVGSASLNMTGSGGNGVRYCTFVDGFSFTNMQNVTTLDLAYCVFANNSQFSVNGASRVYLRYVTLENFGRIIQTAGTLLDMNFTGVRDYAYIYVQGGRLYVNYSSLEGVSYIQQVATVTGTNRVDRVSVAQNSRIRFLNTVNNCRVYYCTINSGSFIECRGTSSGCYFYYNEVTSASQMYCNNSVNLRCYYNTVAGNSQFYSQNVTATHYVYYCSMQGHGYIRFYNSTGGRIYAVHCAGQGLVNFYGANANGRLYYSTFFAYFYLNAANWTITRYGYYGRGRQTLTITNPAANGTPAHNF